jgi:hypothetical protein
MSNQIFDPDVTDQIDDQLSQLLKQLLKDHPDQSIMGEFYLCLQQFAAQVAISGGTSEQDFITGAQEAYDFASYLQRQGMN